MGLLEEIEFRIFELSFFSLTTTQWGFIVFTMIIVTGIILVMGKKPIGKTETFRETIRHDKKPVIGLFVVLPIFLVGYIWAFFYIFGF